MSMNNIEKLIQMAAIEQMYAMVVKLKDETNVNVENKHIIQKNVEPIKKEETPYFMVEINKLKSANLLLQKRVFELSKEIEMIKNSMIDIKSSYNEVNDTCNRLFEKQTVEQNETENIRLKIDETFVEPFEIINNDEQKNCQVHEFSSETKDNIVERQVSDDECHDNDEEDKSEEVGIKISNDKIDEVGTEVGDDEEEVDKVDGDDEDGDDKEEVDKEEVDKVDGDDEDGDDKEEVGTEVGDDEDGDDKEEVGTEVGDDEEDDEVGTEVGDEDDGEVDKVEVGDDKEDEEEEEEVFEIEIDDKSYYATSEENGLLYMVDDDGEVGEKVGIIKDGEPIFDNNILCL